MTSPADKIKERLDQWREIEENATPGPWHWLGKHFKYLVGKHEIILQEIGYSDKGMLSPEREDAELIVFARNNSATHRKAIEKLVEALEYVAKHRCNTIYSDNNAIGAAHKVLAEVAEMLSGGERK